MNNRDSIVLKKMIQYYGEIDTEILWETITGDIQELKSYCLKFI